MHLTTLQAKILTIHVENHILNKVAGQGMFNKYLHIYVHYSIFEITTVPLTKMK